MHIIRYIIVVAERENMERHRSWGWGWSIWHIRRERVLS